MSRRQFDLNDHFMHAIRNRALRRVLDSVLLVQRSRTTAERARALARAKHQSPWEPPRAVGPRRRQRRGRARLRLVKS